MKFMLMMHGTAAGFRELSKWKPEEFKAHIEFMIDFAKKLRASGELVLAEGLEMPSSAKIVRSGEDGRAIVSDGPFAETKEFLAGFWIVEVPDEARAIAIAAAASAAPGPGGKPIPIPIELRAVGQAPKV
ncbi:MAG: hypothetical protein IPJ77_07070 [Planctomycetes bacterium]|nr:hypothetical protein [Planctomycetota bacterium]